ncbi:MAG: putative lipid II flippase FtsW [Pseudomonadota bacterium]
MPQISLSHLFVPWLILLAFGVVMVGSAAVALDAQYLPNHLMFLGVAAVVCAVIFAIPIKLWRSLYLLGWLGSVLIAVVVLLPGIGHEVNGATRWIRLGGFSLQAAEVAKFGLCVFLAGYLARYHDRVSEDARHFIVPFAMIAVVAGLIVAEPDLGSGVVIVAAALGLLFLAGAKLRFFVLFGLLGVGAVYLLVTLVPWRAERLVAFWDPWAVATGSGYQLTQALIAFGRGEIAGLGLGEGVQKLFYLPEAHNDFIFAVVAEELGGLGAILVACLMGFLVVKLFVIARRLIITGQHFGGYVAYFVGLIIGIQLLVNLGVNTGVLPTKGLTLPFVSYGGNSLIISCALFALVLRCVYEERA